MQQQSNPMKILLADDQTSTTSVVAFVLMREGYRVDVVHDGQEALELLKKSPDEYQLLITDHLMKKLTGLELVQKIQKTQFHGKILILSAYVSSDLESSYRKIGVDRFIGKPFDLAELRNAVALTN